MRKLQYEVRVCQKKSIIKSQWQFICSSNLYGPDVSYGLKNHGFHGKFCNISFSLPSDYADETPSETPAPPVEGKEFPGTIKATNFVSQCPRMNLNKKS